jgi:D-alanine-D-alanine ligase
MKKNIAIIAGGYSSEYEVSIKSAKGIMSFIDKELYACYLVVIKENNWDVIIYDDPAKDPVEICNICLNDFSFVLNNNKIRFDFAYITIHGTPGEDGKLQGYFDMMNIPYSSCGTLTAALTCNKFFNNEFLKSQGIRVSLSVMIRKNESYDAHEIVGRLGLPLFVKPNEGGSSFGVTKVKEASLLPAAIEKAFKESESVIIESFIKGTEVTCGCYRTKAHSAVFPITEVVTQNEFFDYDAKYNGQVSEITPARISDDLTTQIKLLTEQIYSLIGARGIIRIDYIIPDDGNPVLLEINTNPGMTPTSFIPQQVRAAGLDIQGIITNIIENGKL